LAVVEVQDHGHRGVFGHVAHEGTHIAGLVVAEEPLEDLENHRPILALGGEQGGFGGFAVDHVEGADGAAFGAGLRQNVVECYEGHGKAF
jgi:hypothetical protein